MSDWEADDFDPSAQVADKIVALGLDRQAEETKTTAPAKDGELTEKEKLEMQMKSDEDIGLDLLGIKTETAKSWDQMRKAADFADYAEELAEQISTHRNHPQFLFFVNTLFNSICKPMNKLQLESVMETVNKHLAPIKAKEEEVKKRQEEEKKQAKAKKIKKKTLYADTVADEYDDFDEKYYA